MPNQRAALVNGTVFHILETLPDGWHVRIRRPRGTKEYVARPVTDGMNLLYGDDRYVIDPGRI